MSAFNRGLGLVLRFIRRLPGGSQSILAEASDGRIYVVKFANNLQGANLPFNESMGSEIYRALELPTPAWRPLVVTNDFLDRNPDCWMEGEAGTIRPSPGLCFGSRFLGGKGVQLHEILPESGLKRINNRDAFWMAWLVDICADHADNRQAVFVESGRGGLKAFFVDHGHLFGGPKAEQGPKFLASRYLDFRIYRGVSSEYLLNLQKALAGADLDRLWKRMRTLPEGWKTVSAVNRFAQCLERLATPKLLGNIVDTMFSAYERSDGFERNGCQHEQEVMCSILRPGLPAAGPGGNADSDRTNHAVCA